MEGVVVLEEISEAKDEMEVTGTLKSNFIQFT